MQFTDAVAVAGTRRLADGYLVAEARCVRTGIQIYSGDEVGKPDMKQVRVYRAPDQVFADASLQSFSHAPITVDHPAEMVTAENWKALSVGEVSTVAKKDGEWVHLPLILKDAAAIQSVIDGKRELSAGYVCELDWTPGMTPSGEAYDAQQTGIKINHLALVDRARAGSQARIGDGANSWGASPVITTADERNPEMPDNLRKVLVDGLQVETTDAGAVALDKLLKDTADLRAQIATLNATHATALADKDKAIAAKDAEIDALKAKVVDGPALDKLVATRASLVNAAMTIAKDVKTDGLSDADIRKAVVIAKLGDAAVKDKTAAYIDARFDILVDEAKAGGIDPFRAAVKDGLKPADHAPAETAHKAMTDHLASAWQNQKGAA